MQRRSGFALTIALVIAMVCFLIATAMVATSRMELQATTGRALRTQRYFAARGQVQELIALISSGLHSPEDFPSDHPFTTEVDGIEVEAWAVPEDQLPGTYHILAMAEGETSECTVVLAGPAGSGTFSSVVNKDPFNPDRFLTQSGDQGWTVLPDPPDYVHLQNGGTSSDGVLLSRQYVADDQGHLFVGTFGYVPPGVGLFRFEPLSQSWEDLGPVPAFAWLGDGPILEGVAYRLGQDDGEQWTVTRAGTAL